MPAKIRIVLNPAGIRELLTQDQGIKDDLSDRAEAIKRQADAGVTDNSGADVEDHIVDEWTGKDRSRATIRTNSYAARVAEAEDHNLLKALDAGRSP
jgi:hypothetical protein